MPGCSEVMRRSFFAATGRWIATSAELNDAQGIAGLVRIERRREMIR
jgi:hypothetical protein